MSSTNPTRLTEDMGPSEAECPERILSLLGDTDNHSALNWRRRCIDNLARCQSASKRDPLPASKRDPLRRAAYRG